MLTGKIHNEGHFGFSDFISKDAAFPDTILMHMHHDPIGVVLRFVEKMLQHMNNKFHRCEIIIQQQYTVEVRLFGHGLRAGDHRRARMRVIPAPTGGSRHRTRNLERAKPLRRKTNQKSQKCPHIRLNAILLQNPGGQSEKECADRAYCSSYAFEAPTTRGSKVASAQKGQKKACKIKKGPETPDPERINTAKPAESRPRNYFILELLGSRLHLADDRFVWLHAVLRDVGVEFAELRCISHETFIG
jgi:hypothetical protein